MNQRKNHKSEIALLQAEIVALKKERESFRKELLLDKALLESFDGCVWLIDSSCTLLENNAEFEREMKQFYGFSPAKGDFIFKNHSLESEPVKFWRSHYDIALAGNPHSFVFPIQLPGEKQYHQCNFTPIRNEKGEVTGLCCFKINISQRRNVETLMQNTQEKLSLSLKIAKLGMWTLYAGTKEIHLSKEMQMMLEMNPPYNEPLIMNLTEYQKKYVHPKSKTLFSEGVSQLLENLENIGYEDKYEYILQSARGNERIIFVKRRVVAKGVIEGVSQDITDFHIIEREHAQLTADLMQKVKDADQFTYIISHNLRSPVARILGLASIFQPEDSGNPHNHFVIENIQKTANQLDTVIKGLNELLSLKNDHQHDFTQINLLTLLSEVKEFVRADIEKALAEIHFDISADLEITAIPSYIHSIFTNLFTNAIKYKYPDRNPVIHVTTIKENTGYLIKVSDNGKGMDMNKIKSRLFSPFSRFDNSSRIEGKGLGLFLVKSQVENMGGKIEVESKLEEGTIFSIFLPAKR
ncbi:MAG: HAMP domain-containing histidine kinase [Bacteroidia bacterium]|nr:HAMP domain-containing histidine kinase [Bacteroidia bacterium]